MVAQKDYKSVVPRVFQLVGWMVLMLANPKAYELVVPKDCQKAGLSAEWVVLLDDVSALQTVALTGRP